MIYRILCSLFLGCLTLSGQAADVPSIIPVPMSYRPVAGTFVLTDETPVVAAEPSFSRVAEYLRNRLLAETGIRAARSGSRQGITLKRGGTGKSAYELTVSPQGTVISAPDEEGAFYGAISFLQLADGKRTVAGWNIQDKPAWEWRGFMLDESRHFFGKAVVKRLLEQMAYYKLNRFHWHLTDEPGWRIEIKQYPRLTLFGGVGNMSDSLAPARYYSQEDIREIVAFAAERHIVVIPEIDMPGHATAANKAYPAYSGGGSEKHPEFTFNPGKEETYGYLSDILKEVDVLFPSGMVHIGGDEVSFGNDKWVKDPSISRLMTKNGYKTALDVEHYFLRRMADTLRKRNVRLLAWDEVTQAGLSPENTLVFWWRHDQPAQLQAALDKKYPVVLCPRLPFYYDFVQDSTHVSGRKWGGRFNPLQDVYAFSPAAYGSPDLIKGIQANLWTETVATADRLEFMTFPRIVAMAEAAWSREKNYTSFMQRLPVHLQRFRRQGVRYFDPFRPAQSPEPLR